MTDTPPPTSWGQRPDKGLPPKEPKKKKSHRIFLWFFLAVQVIFLIWIITGASSGEDSSCEGMTGDALRVCQDAGDVGTAIGVGLIIALWAAVDVILGITYAVYRLSRRQRA
ncbi:hypothetical protein ACPXCO_38170 [Streptomyces cyaneofuscatus]|uniref:hypothetical protein n=1 Tax=Streptomyces TaxID=1883 RepID=UPI001929C5C6|nr:MULTISPECIES: hypothetical protein [unclassified Streptomyces]